MMLKPLSPKAYKEVKQAYQGLQSMSRLANNTDDMRVMALMGIHKARDILRGTSKATAFLEKQHRKCVKGSSMLLNLYKAPTKPSPSTTTTASAPRLNASKKPTASTAKVSKLSPERRIAVKRALRDEYYGKDAPADAEGCWSCRKTGHRRDKDDHHSMDECPNLEQAARAYKV